MIAPVSQHASPARAHVGWRAFCADLRDSVVMLIAVPLLLAVFLAATTSSARSHPVFTLLFCAAISVLTCVGQSALYTLLLARLSPRAEGLWAMFLRAVAVGSAVALAAELTLRACEALGILDDASEDRASVMLVSVLVGATVFAVSLAFDRVQARRRAAEQREAQLTREVLRAQLTALKARTNPHFLFNALNTVASLIDDRPADAERAVERLSEIFRYALDGSARPWVRVDDELEAVRGYLEVEHLRFGERLRVREDIDPSCGAALVPPLVLQPLVENAVAHAATQRRDGATVYITVTRDPEREQLVLTVEDDGPGPGGSQRVAGSGTALADLEQRLRLSYPGGGATLSTGARAGGGFVAEVRVPTAAPEAETA
ncbi:signal transduction histidine kinase, LytS [Haliangium ochraceum DSM 14365]|uniref:Signal transduction histidine kinase, LytS n=1 Tax=Haliangium ochraceum (strain DSM 14365 / JCM 11303 / SMP-2) TaxID=502025 RepID=D0LSR8_HALO1|nr:signal transduction histidine kinase, LytS [Haliangium ochraceum DSM 14365]